jgi:X-X-X-Leu-X-X-Gly heptad repeat protein
VIGSHRHLSMHVADRHCPDENLLRQNCFHLKMNGSKAPARVGVTSGPAVASGSAALQGGTGQLVEAETVAQQLQEAQFLRLDG